MRRFRVALAAALLAAAAPAGAQVLTFEDYAPCDNATPVGAYGPADFLGNWTCYGFAQDPYNPSSGTNRVYSGLADASFAFFAPLQFDGAWFAGTGGTTVQFQSYLSGALVGASGVLAVSDVPTFLSSGVLGPVDEVHVLTNSVQNYIMDDVTFNGGVSAVPEPATLALVGGGLALVGIVARRRRASA